MCHILIAVEGILMREIERGTLGTSRFGLLDAAISVLVTPVEGPHPLAGSKASLKGIAVSAPLRRL